MFGAKLSNLFSRLAFNGSSITSRNVSISAPVFLNITNVLFAEPLKKKKKMDPALVRAKEERRKRKLEKQIRKLEKHTKQLKPISELEVTTKLRDQIPLRKRPLPVLSLETLEARAQLFKDWTRYKSRQHHRMVNLIDQYIFRQDKALEELRAVSEERYQEAIQIDPDLLPYTAKGPVHTPPIENYDVPDGDYTDVTKKYEGE